MAVACTYSTFAPSIYCIMINKFTLLSATFALLTISAIAQPTLTSNFNPVNGTIGTQAAADTNGVKESAAGANQTYNFSNLTQVGQPVSYTYVLASTTPYASQYQGANLSYAAKSTQGNTGYTYIKTTNNSYELLGVATADVQFVYTNSQLVMSYPFTYNSTFTDYFEGSGENSQGVETFRKGYTTSTADGHGTLTLPNGTFTNVLRVKTVQDYKDSFDFLGDAYEYKYFFTTYSYYSNDYRMPLLSISYNEITEPFLGSTSVSKSVAFYPNSTTSVQENEPNTINVYPNPASDRFFVNNNNAEITTVEILDMTGKSVLSTPYTAGNGVSTNELPAGIYMVRLWNGELTIGTQRINIVK